MEASEPLDTVLRYYETEAQKHAHNPVSPISDSGAYDARIP